MGKVLELHWPAQAEIDALISQVAGSADLERAAVRLVKSPYRICPLGAHIDHQGGLVSAAALDFGVLLAFVPTEGGRVSLTSSTFPGAVEFSTSAVPPARRPAPPGAPDDDEPGCWGNFPRGAAFALQRSGYGLPRGLTGRLWAPAGLDSGGISSSAAVGVACLLALEAANGLAVAAEDNIELDRLIENKYLGLKNGILDQSAILMARAGQLTLIDCAARRFSHVPPPWLSAGAPPPFRVVLAFSGLRAALAAGSTFNTRVAECEAAAAELLAAARRDAGGAVSGRETDGASGASGSGGAARGGGGRSGDPVGDGIPDAGGSGGAAGSGGGGESKGESRGGGAAILGDVTPDEWARLEKQIGPTSANRARHFFGENARVAAGADAWRAGDLARFGDLMRESGLSSIHNYEVGTPHLIKLQSLLHEAPGVIGARFSGAGTRGACVALVHRDAADGVARQVLDAYCQAFPELASEAQVVVTDCGDGAHVAL